MRMVGRGVVLLVVVWAVACTSGPNSPSSAMASIAGTVRSGSGSNGSSSSLTSPVRVMVSGTSLQTTTKSSGQFDLRDVPPGIVTLLFEGTGVSARLPLGELRPGDRVTITVTVNGSNVRLDSRHDDHDDEVDDDDDENEVEGRITDLTGGCPDRTFKILNTTVKASAATKFEHVTCATLANDMRIEAEGTFANGVLNATKIEKE